MPQTLTVKQLIEKLQQLPADQRTLPVFYPDPFGQGEMFPVTEVGFVKKDARNPWITPGGENDLIIIS